MDNQELEFEVLETDIGIFTENKVLGLTAQEVYEKELKRREQIDNSLEVKSNRELTEELNSALKTIADLEIEIVLLK